MRFPPANARRLRDRGSHRGQNLRYSDRLGAHRRAGVNRYAGTPDCAAPRFHYCCKPNHDSAHIHTTDSFSDRATFTDGHPRRITGNSAIGDTGHAIVATTQQGDRLPVTGRNADSTWLEVTLPDGRSGWIAASLAQLNVPPDTVAVAQVIPTPPPAPTPGPAAGRQPAAGKRDLQVSFINPHYDCEQGELLYKGDDGNRYPIWGYRYFQVDMFIKNNGSEPIVPPWKVKRWIITDGVTDSVSDLVWEWMGQSGFYAQPTIQPGQNAGWTYVSFPIARNQWLKAVEFVWNGQVYRQEFDLGQFGNAHNYQDCGEPRSHTDRPTPTPRP